MPLRKIFLYFKKCNFLAPILKIFLYFRKEVGKTEKQKVTSDLVCTPKVPNNKFFYFLSLLDIMKFHY